MSSVTYEEFCNRYELNPKLNSSKQDYLEYREKLELFERVVRKPHK